MPSLPIQVLGIRHAKEPGAFLLSMTIGTEVFLFHFTIASVPVGDHPLQVIQGERGFERTFLSGPHIKRAAGDLVGRVASGQRVELPFLLGEWEPDTELNRNWQHNLEANGLPQAAG